MVFSKRLCKCISCSLAPRQGVKKNDARITRLVLSIHLEKAGFFVEKSSNLRMEGREIYGATVDGSNPAPVDMANIPLFIGFHTSQVVVWDFSPQQYHGVSEKKIPKHYRGAMKFELRPSFDQSHLRE